jgi:selenocysteine lyase/cysteine desulfurase
VGAPLERVAIGPQVSYFTGIVAASLPAGAEVVGYENDFPSLLYPFLARGDLDVRLVPLEEVAGAIRSTTAVVAIGAVQFADGRVSDLESIRTAAAAAGDVLTLVDATQASGWLPLDASRFDFVVAGTYKWLLSPRGSAFMAMRPEHIPRLSPTAPGWYAAERPWDSLAGPMLLAHDARRYDMSPAWLAWVGTAESLDYLSGIGVEAIHEHDVALANGLREELGMPPSDSAIVSLDVGPDASQRVTDAGIRAAVRSGRLRVAFHLYNTRDDVDLLLSALR